MSSSENSIFKIQKENNYVSIDNNVFTEKSYPGRQREYWVIS